MSSGFGTDTKDQVKKATDIVDLVGSYAQLRRSGSGYVCHCPWHDDQRPSLQVNPARQSWVCWVCNVRGDVFDFVMRKESVEFFEALRILAERAGIEIKTSGKKIVKGSPQDKQALYRAMQWAVERYHHHLLHGSDAEPVRNYLSERKFSSEAIAKFKLGFAPLKWSWLADQSNNTEFSQDILAACDLIAASERSGNYYERFRGRLIFPIFDTMGRPTAIGGRMVPGIDLGDQKGKYVNSRETRLFTKSDTLYGLNYVKDAVSKTRSLIVVEGYTDVIAAWQAGLENVVACLGTALNQKHIRLIKRFADQITLVLDGDDAGQKRANEILDLFVANDVDLRILSLPENQDPMDFLQSEGGEAFNRLVEGAVDAIEHKIQIETRGVDLVADTHKSNVALDRILQTLARVPSSVFTSSADKIIRRDQLLTRLARKFGVDREQLKARLAELRSKIRTYDEPHESLDRGQEIDFSKLLRRETELIQLILHASDHLDTIIENIAPDQFVEGPLKRLYLFIDQCFQNGDGTTFEELMLSIEEPDLKNVLVYLDNQWHQMQSSKSDTLQPAEDKIVNEILDVFRDLEMESGKRQKISELQQQLDEKDELTTLEDLLNQTRQRHGL